MRTRGKAIETPDLPLTNRLHTHVFVQRLDVLHGLYQYAHGPSILCHMEFVLLCVTSGHKKHVVGRVIVYRKRQIVF